MNFTNPDKDLNSKKNLIIGSRGSDLALWQAHYIQNLLLDRCSLKSDIKIIKTKGDQIQDIGFDKMEGKGFFTKEIEEALLNKSIDLAVHSYKDLETTSPEGLIVAAVSERQNPSDVLLIRKEAVDLTEFWELKQGSKIGTSSARRKSQLRLFRNDLQIEDLRGNVPTRVEKLRLGQYDAVLLAKAGLDRLQLDLSDLHVVVLDPSVFIPAPAQGVLALQIRTEDDVLRALLQSINHSKVEQEIALERSILKAFGGGCQVPIGVYVNRKQAGYEVFVSNAIDQKKPPLQSCIFVETPSVKELVHQFKNTRPSRVFISSDAEDAVVFVRMLQGNDFSVTAQSLIKTELLQNLPHTLPKSDWLFFNSKNAVDHFLEQYPHKTSAKIGVAGLGTQRFIQKRGFQPQFVATESNMKDSAQKFSAQVLPHETVLFPESSNTLGTFQHFLKEVQVISFPIYQSKNKPTELEKHDIYVFTSPSNVRSFFMKNTMPDKAIVLAMGERTKLELQNHNVNEVYCPRYMNMLGLAREVVYRSGRD